ncbi:Tumor protein p53-inducible protein 11 [Liparis tanakae]|uniref:Tumor protein p53-inducible protein 11 n=1 Tax=Liparis tanakae TaxID=230148 RepID=A0A4Z2IVI3_9TELE|nr:Tumor protein p53-inducible protein 11 [Liparis tanakae]
MSSPLKVLAARGSARRRHTLSAAPPLSHRLTLRGDPSTATVCVCAMSSKPHPPLMKKHSQTDLISRLKSRKILGVGGEDDDGEVHRSKISQMLGNEMKFAVREPIGLRMWILMSAVGFTAMAVMALVFPNQLYEVVFEEELSTTSLSVRLYGGALLSLALIMWNGLYTAEKLIIQWTLLSEACYFAVQFLVTSITLMEVGILPNAAILLLLSRVLFLVVSMAYYYSLGRKSKKI